MCTEKTFGVIRVELGVIEAKSIEDAENKSLNEGFSVGHSTEFIYPDENDEDNFLANFEADQILAMKLLIEELEEKLSRSITWSIDDFESRASEREEWKTEIIYDRKKFKEALETMINKHDASLGISWDTIDVYLDEICKTSFYKLFGHIWSQIDLETVERLWEKEPIFGYDLENEEESQLNVKGAVFNEEELKKWHCYFYEKKENN